MQDIICPYCGKKKEILDWFRDCETAGYLDFNNDYADEIHVVICPECKKEFKIINQFRMTALGTRVEEE